MKLKLFFALTTVVVLISFAACSQPAAQPQTETQGYCDRIQENLKEAQRIALQLQHFDWDEFSSIGILYPPPGICPVGNLPIVERSSLDSEQLSQVVDLLQGLPSPTTAETYSIQCDSCLKLAREVCSNIPASGETTDSDVTTQWQQSCAQLISALQGAEYLASRDKSIVAEYAFPKLFAYFTSSDEKIKHKYLDKFTAKSDEYIGLYDDFIRNMQDARQAVIDLSGYSPGPDEP
ncbi:MAG TPA: hypothetical protein VF366_04355 [Dehalococcoidia bacterium]|jgi:hypothetical protein